MELARVPAFFAVDVKSHGGGGGARRWSEFWRIPLRGEGPFPQRGGLVYDFFMHQQITYGSGREITLGELGTREGLLGGINAVIVGNYLTTLGRSAQDDVELLAELKMPMKALNDTL